MKLSSATCYAVHALTYLAAVVDGIAESMRAALRKVVLAELTGN